MDLQSCVLYPFSMCISILEISKAKMELLLRITSHYFNIHNAGIEEVSEMRG